jgi:uncharacterized membrane protein (DUF4010 family)
VGRIRAVNVPEIRQTKFLLTCAAFLSSCAFVAAGKATFSEWGVFVSSLFAIYGSADVVNTHLQQQKKIPLEDQTA